MCDDGTWASSCRPSFTGAVNYFHSQSPSKVFTFSYSSLAEQRLPSNQPSSAAAAAFAQSLCTLLQQRFHLVDRHPRLRHQQRCRFKERSSGCCRQEGRSQTTADASLTIRTTDLLFIHIYCYYYISRKVYKYLHYYKMDVREVRFFLLKSDLNGR